MTDDEILDRMDSGIPPASPEEAARRRPYEELFALIRSAPPGLERRVAALREIRRRRRRMLVLGSVAIAIGAAAVIAALA